MRLVLTQFRGLAPALDRRKLPIGSAQVAENVKFDAGDLQPIRSMQAGPIITGDIGNLHWYRNGDDSKLIAFGRNLETYGFRSPVPNDEHRRWYWNVRGDGLFSIERGMFAIADPVNPSPAGVASAVGSGAMYRQYQGYNVGIPAPQAAPSIQNLTTQEAVGFGTDNAVVSIARTNPITINTEHDHNFRSGQRVRITIDESLPEPTGGTGGGGGPPPQTVFTVASFFEGPGGELVAAVNEDITNIVGTHALFQGDSGFPGNPWPGDGEVREILSVNDPPANQFILEGPFDPYFLDFPPGATTLTVTDATGEPETVEGQIWGLDGLGGIVAGVTENSFDIVGVSGTGFQEFTAAELEAIKIEVDLVDDDFEARAYVWTYVSQFGEEGPPSEASNVLDIPKVGGVVQINMTDVAHAFTEHGGSRDYVNRIRVYRTVAGTAATFFVFVGELGFDGTDGEGISWETPPASTNAALDWSGTAIESVDSVSLGEPMRSQGWFPPPRDMLGIHLLPNGIAVGWKENNLYFSEPYLPHAWDPDNARTTDDDILGVQSYGNTLVIGTRGRPYICTGIDPQSMSLRKLDLHAPLLHRRAMVDAGTGVFFPSTEGLAWVGAGGTRYLTTQRYDRRAWEEAIDDRPQGVFHDRRGLFFGPGIKPLMADVNGGEPEFSEVNIDIGAAVRAERDLIVVTRAVDNQYRQVQVFKEQMPPMTGLWESGLLATEKPCNLAAGQIYADAYPVTLRVKHANLGASGQPNLQDFGVHAYTVEGPEPFRMRADYLSREFIIELETQHRVQQVILATSIAEIRALP